MATMLFLSHLLPLLLLQFSSSLAYSPPDKYFLNCGSKSDTELINNRRFIGDAKRGAWLIYPGKSEVVKNESIPKSIDEIYHSARVYKKPTWYVFGNMNPNGTYMVRLHFFPTLPQIMSEARFNVSASCGFQLLSNFSVENDLKKAAVVKEFVFEIKEGPFGIKFSPLVESSLAFVNAIELFLVPVNIKPEIVLAISPEVRRLNGRYYMLASQAFQTVHRVWMGSSLITPDKDTLWRTWLPDSEFMALSSPAKTVTFNKRLNYNKRETFYVAPVYVFSTAKALDVNTTSSSTHTSKLTWVFNVKKKSKYFLRLLWCDIITPHLTTFKFDLFVGVNHTSLQSSDVTEEEEFALPFWYELLIVTDSSGYFNVGIGQSESAPLSRAFLNGIEIIELIEKSFVGPVDLSIKEEKQRPKMIIVGVCVGSAVIVALIIGLALFCFVQGQKSRNHRHLLLPQNDPLEKAMSIVNLAPNLKNELKIPFGVINDATDGFHEKKMIGIGGFGKVYVGRIGEKDVAVKRSQPGHGQGIREFQTEVTIFSQIRHHFLVSLYGYCDENQEMILVYEYMEGGNLRDYLYGSKEKDHVSLSWKKRLEICIDVAKGIDYLHTGSIMGIIIHRDIKTTNILLDKDLNAKVADFGISKIRVPDATEMEITNIRGTCGYMDPEYFNTGQLKEKFDVYSFGVVLFEVLSARAPIKKFVPSEEINLVDWVVRCKSRGEIEKVIDPFLVGTIEMNSLRKFLEVAEKCVGEVGENRPSMHDVVYDLELALQFLFAPTGDGKGYEGMSTTIVEAPWEIDSGILDRIPSKGIDDSVMLDETSTTVNAKKLAVEFKIDCAR